MKEKILLSGGIIVILLVTFFSITLLANLKKQVPPPSTQPFPTPTPITLENSWQQTTHTIALPEANTDANDATQTIQVRDFSSAPLNSAQQSILTETETYTILYVSQQNLFSIIVTAAPFDVYRKSAETAFLKILNISSSDACLLNVRESSPAKINPSLVGQVFGLSFCPSPTPGF